MRAPIFVFETVVILSTLKRYETRRPSAPGDSLALAKSPRARGFHAGKTACSFNLRDRVTYSRSWRCSPHPSRMSCE